MNSLILFLMVPYFIMMLLGSLCRGWFILMGWASDAFLGWLSFCMLSQDEKKTGASPLSQYVATLHERSRQRNDSLMESRFIPILYVKSYYFSYRTIQLTSQGDVLSSVLVGANSSVFGSKQISENDDDNDDDDTKNEEGTAAFSSSWLPGIDSKYGY